MTRVLSPAPLDLIDLLLNFKGFEVIEFRLVRLEFCMKFVFACFFLESVSFAIEC